MSEDNVRRNKTATSLKEVFSHTRESTSLTEVIMGQQAFPKSIAVSS